MTIKLILENWRKYLDEVEAMDSIPGMETQEGRQRSIDYFWDGGRENLEDEKDPATGYPRFKKINRKDAGNWKGYQMVLFNDPSGRDTFYFLLDGETPIFYIGTEPHKDGMITGNVRKSGGNFRSTDFYKWLIDQHGVIYSDKIQSPEGRGKIWDWLLVDDDLNVELVDEETVPRFRAERK